MGKIFRCFQLTGNRRFVNRNQSRKQLIVTIVEIWRNLYKIEGIRIQGWGGGGGGGGRGAHGD